MGDAGLVRSRLLGRVPTEGSDEKERDLFVGADGIFHDRSEWSFGAEWWDFQ
jgi:hypothetical protein